MVRASDKGQTLRTAQKKGAAGPFSPVLRKQMERADTLLITPVHLWEATPQGRSLLLTASPPFQPSSRRQAGPSQLSRPPCQGASLTQSQRTQMPRPPLLQAPVSRERRLIPGFTSLAVTGAVIQSLRSAPPTPPPGLRQKRCITCTANFRAATRTRFHEVVQGGRR